MTRGELEHVIRAAGSIAKDDDIVVMDWQGEVAFPCTTASVAT